jgi:hypothetical protein
MGNYASFEGGALTAGALGRFWRLAVARMLSDELSREGITHEDVSYTPRDREHSISGRCLLIRAR